MSMSVKPWDEKTLFVEPAVWPADDDLQATLFKCNGHLYLTEGEKTFKSRPAGVRPIWIEGGRYAGKSTRHFAWFGLPKNTCGRAKNVPAMVLVHGGGGTAFCKWVEKWNKRGYAAIAVDTCGHLPIAPKYGQWISHEFSHDFKWGDFANADKPASDQWCYHAVTAIIRAHSFLRSLPEVNTRKIGITGISWGGYLTSIASVLDSRFHFAVPIYGCGFLDHGSPWVADLDKLSLKLKKRWLKLWDPSSYMHLSKVPTLWVTGSNDHAYNLDMLSRSKAACGTKVILSIHIRYPHSHQHGWKLREPYIFADSFCKKMPKLKSPTIKVIYREVVATANWAVKATLCITKNSGNIRERYWKQIKMRKIHDGRFLAILPADITGWFVNITDSDGNITSSDVTFVANVQDKMLKSSREL